MPITDPRRLRNAAERGSPAIRCVTFRGFLCLALLASFGALSAAPRAAERPVLVDDPHRNAVGFFDLHVCNWPDRQPFFLALFSSRRFSEIREIAVHYPDGTLLTRLRLDRYRIIQKKGKPEKRVFMLQTPLSDAAVDGWYSARVLTNDGAVQVAKDFVIAKLMPRSQLTSPPAGAQDIAVPSTLEWTPLAGARYYRVWIRDKWDDGRIILESKLLDESRLVLPPGLIKPGGWYEWWVHARDVNEHVLLGDFNHGSLSTVSDFSVKDDDAQ